MHSGPPGCLSDNGVDTFLIYPFAEQNIRVNSNSLVKINFFIKSLNSGFRKQPFYGGSLGKPSFIHCTVTFYIRPDTMESAFEFHSTKNRSGFSLHNLKTCFYAFIAYLTVQNS